MWPQDILVLLIRNKFSFFFKKKDKLEKGLRAFLPSKINS